MNDWWKRLRIGDYVLVDWGMYVVSSTRVEQLKVIGRAIIDGKVHIVVKCISTQNVGSSKLPFTPKQAEQLGIHPVYRKLPCWRFPENDPRVKPVPTFPYAKDTIQSLDRKHKSMPSIFKRLREVLVK